ncbi:uncharacterized protein LOC113522888 [Galleria mellonella]|uniref:Uncharacterized protein LOC113522888 n=1 Tax=Galleria mellonella TaxID=7137 RepID=A0A6J1X974_GALME|nr:uncharacterized protein LOC113522888 [Galleria mellonella]
MPFMRHLDASFPHVWDRWEANGTKWTIQDLPPSDEDEALDILLKHLCPDEVLCALSDIINDPVSVQCISKVWRYYFQQRTTLACYAESAGERKLVALNVCAVKEKGEELSMEVVGKKWENVYKVLEYMESKVDCLEYMGLDKALTALGLVVRKEYRGAKLGARVLAAREPLCQHLGIKGTLTIFTGIASQKSAVSCGFTSVLEVSIRELAEIGLDYPKDDNRLIKLMVKKYE